MNESAIKPVLHLWSVYNTAGYVGSAVGLAFSALSFPKLAKRFGNAPPFETPFLHGQSLAMRIRYYA
jgi:hypothetical protein